MRHPLKTQDPEGRLEPGGGAAIDSSGQCSVQLCDLGPQSRYPVRLGSLVPDFAFKNRHVLLRTAGSVGARERVDIIFNLVPDGQSATPDSMGS